MRKKDGTNRFCIDFRKLNKVALFDPEPVPSVENLMVKVGEGRIYTKLDLSKGYWQLPIPVEERCKTAFATHNGLYQFKVMPFGVVNASAVFTRMMRRLLQGLSNVVSYIDDVLIFSVDWQSHVKVVREVLQRLRNAGLTARPTKCCFGFPTVEFLGHTVSEGVLRPQSEKVEKILDAVVPRTKKEIRSFMGLVGYYSKFVPNLAAIAAPLTDLTKSSKPNKVEWGEPQDRAFLTLKSRLASGPILRLPDFDKPFILRTDASDVGIAAVLMQEWDGVKHPISFASRKLQPREIAYSTIEKECLALVWAVEKFQMYLYGAEFVLETDHHPLAHIMKAKMKNNRVMRWALCLQPFRFVVKAIKGSENYGADFLSRCGSQ